jgi:hypothetical protein
MPCQDNNLMRAVQRQYAHHHSDECVRPTCVGSKNRATSGDHRDVADGIILRTRPHRTSVRITGTEQELGQRNG